MTDLEKVKRCAERIMRPNEFYEVSGNKPEHTIRLISGRPSPHNNYWPLTNKAQAFELVERLELEITRGPVLHGRDELREEWTVTVPDGLGAYQSAFDADLCRAIVECVALMRATQTATRTATSA